MMGKRGGQSFRQPTSRRASYDGLTEHERDKQRDFTEWGYPDEIFRKQAEDSYWSEGRRNGLRGNALKEYVEDRLKRREVRHSDKFKYHRRSDGT